MSISECMKVPTTNGINVKRTPRNAQDKTNVDFILMKMNLWSL